jgi:16S rRNA processing protein RimM
LTRGLWPCGVLGRPHGLHGEIALDPLPDGARYLAAGVEFFLSKGGQEQPVSVGVERVGGMDRRPLLRFAGVTSREAAAALTGSLLLAAGGVLDALPQHVVGELLGLRAVCGDRELGTVTDVLQGVVQDILQIRSAEGEEVLVPLVDELVTVDRVAGVILVRDGLL